MRYNDFRDEVHEIFGAGMAHATPAHMRKFLSCMHDRINTAAECGHPVIIPKEHAANYEQVVNQFFARVLDLPPEQAVMLLWLFASEMFYSRLGEQYNQELAELLIFEIPE